MVWFSCNIVSTVIVYFFIPETRYIPLEEIGALFGDEVAVHLTADGHAIVEQDRIQDSELLDVVGEKGGASSHGEVSTANKTEAGVTESRPITEHSEHIETKA